MKTCTKCKSVKPATTEFFSPDTKLLSGFSSWCRKCSNAGTRAWRAANPEAANAGERAWQAANKEAAMAKNQAWRAANPVKHRAFNKEWAQANPAKCAAYSKKRQATKLNAIPKWADEAKTLAVYVRAVAKTKATGIPHVVDHVVPLQSKFVCGLHYHKNLRVITAKANSVKGNRIWPNMP